MKGYQIRVVNERTDLCDKIKKLKAFVCSQEFFKLSTEDRERLDRQLGLMVKYEAVLTERIEAFND